ncbi:MAG: hypothetical protein SNH01_05215 [Rikenellaceae bacterium]
MTTNQLRVASVLSISALAMPLTSTAAPKSKESKASKKLLEQAKKKQAQMRMDE